MYKLILEFSLVSLVIVLFITQIIIPLFLGINLFPMFNKYSKLMKNMQQVRQTKIEETLKEQIKNESIRS